MQHIEEATQQDYAALDELRAELVSHTEGLDIVALATTLLRICRQHRVELTRVLNEPAMSAQRAEQRRAATRFFETIDDEVLDQDDLMRLTELLAHYAAACGSQILPVRAVAEGLDASLGPRFAGCFRKTRITLHANSACPISHPPLRSILGRLTSAPDTITSPLDGLHHLRLTPADMGRFKVVIDGRLDDQLSVLDKDGQLVSAVPSAGLHNYEWDDFELHKQPLFYNVRPKSASQQLDVIKTLLMRSDEAGADVIVLPELCITYDVVEELFTYFRDATRALTLVVIGSAHARRTNEDPGRNQAFAFVRGHHEPLVHEKFTRFELSSGEAATLPRAEYIRTDDATLTLYVTGGWCFTFVVCKDLLEVPVVQILSELRVRLALVAALSPKTEMFEQRARELAMNSQAIVGIANTPSAESAATVIFAQPTRDIDPISVFYLKDGDTPCAYVLKLGQEAQQL